MTALVEWIETDEIRYAQEEQINERLRYYMLHNSVRKVIPQIKLRKNVKWNGHLFRAGLILEGVIPIGCTTNGDGQNHSEIVFTFSSSDSNYTQAIGCARLSNIEYIEER